MISSPAPRDFTPRCPDWEAKVRGSFAKQNAMKTMGIEIADLTPGAMTLSMPFNTDFTQQHGFLHAGVVTTALDSACGYAAHSLMEDDASVLSVEFKSNFLSPAKGDAFVFKATVVKSGRTITVAEAAAYAISGGTEKLFATMTATLMAIQDRPDVKE
ncbi:MAG: PaaI family thioesterase [Cognatishimia sp.]|uniref:PaaI family thioesterase n=1 Tax=Cognatishimia sp. TaxID=2211648 RepID=UPI003B8BAE41